MNNSNNKRKPRALFKLAAIGGLIITVTTFVINIFGMDSDSSRFAIAFYEGMPFALVLELLGLGSLGQAIGKSFVAFGLLAPIADGLAIFLLLLLLGFFWQFITRGSLKRQDLNNRS